MRWLIHILLPFLAIFLQSTFFSSYSIKGAVPDLLIIIVTFFALVNEREKAPAYGFFCGLIEDLYFGRFIGMNALAKGLTAFMITHWQGNVFRENILVGMVTVMLATAFNSVMLMLLNLVRLSTFNWDAGMLMMIFIQILYNGVLSGPLYIWYYNSSKFGVLRFTGER